MRKRKTDSKRLEIDGKVLCIDADPANHAMVASVLAVAPGVELRIAVNGQSGIRAVHTRDTGIWYSSPCNCVIAAQQHSLISADRWLAATRSLRGRDAVGTKSIGGCFLAIFAFAG